MIVVLFQDYTIQIGKSKKENDKLITDASENDYWLHLSDYPSGHGIIQNPFNQKIPRKVLKHACVLIKQHSKYKSERKVSIDITLIKHISKTKRLGEVIVEKILRKIII